MAYVTVSNVMCLLGVMSPWILIQVSLARTADLRGSHGQSG
jgi:hypothetical protein